MSDDRRSFRACAARIDAASREPLTPSVQRGLLALVIFFHVGGGWALTQVEPIKLIVGDIAPMEVRMVPAEQSAPARQSETPQPTRRRRRSSTPPPDRAARVDDPPPLRTCRRRSSRRQSTPPAAAGPATEKPKPPAAQAGAEAAAGAAGAGEPAAAARRRPPPRRPRRCRPRSSAIWCRPTRSTRRARARPASRAVAMVRVLIDVAGPADPGLAADLVGSSRARRVRPERRARRAVPALRRGRHRAGGVGPGSDQFCVAVGGDVMGDASSLGFGHFLGMPTSSRRFCSPCWSSCRRSPGT